MTEVTPDAPPRARRIPWMWLVALLAVALAVGVVVAAQRQRNVVVTSVIEDRAGDVVGTAIESATPRLDLRQVTLTRKAGDFVLTYELRQVPPRPDPGAEPVVFSGQFRSGNVTYELRVYVGAGRSEAYVTDTAAIDSPYGLPVPSVSGRTVAVKIPKAAVPKLRDVFSWGVAARIDGSEDVAPSDRTSLFPPIDEQG